MYKTLMNNKIREKMIVVKNFINKMIRSEK